MAQTQQSELQMIQNMEHYAAAIEAEFSQYLQQLKIDNTSLEWDNHMEDLIKRFIRQFWPEVMK